jgi:hypothetical protein
MFKSFVIIAIAIGVAALSTSNLEPLFVRITASVVDRMGLETGRMVPLAQSTADTETLKSADKVTPSLAEFVAKPVDQSQTPTRSPRHPAKPVQSAQAQVPASLAAEPQWTPR